MAFLADPGVCGTRCRTRSAAAAAQASLNCKWQAFLGWNEFEIWDGTVGLVPACSAPLQLFIYSITLLSKFSKGRDMSIIAVLNPKGGCGKTTISTNLARALHDRGCSVLIVDSDPQGSARDWHAVNEDNPVELVALDRPSSVRTLASIAVNYDYVVIDGAAKLEDMVAACIKVSDFILIPVQPSPYDIWAASDLVEFVKARQEVTDGVPLAGFVVSRAVEGTRLGADVRAALDEYALPVFAAAITQRQVYPQTAAEGLTVFDADNVKARTEAAALIDEVLAMMPPVAQAVA